MKKYLYGNWKMNLLPQEARDLAASYAEHISGSPDENSVVGVAPTALCLESLCQAEYPGLQIGAQNAHFKDSGACTGEISSSMCKAIGADFVIIGHSERRHDFAESQLLTTQRAAGVLEQGLKLVYCIGETQAENEDGKTFEVLQSQLNPIYPLITPENLEQLIIAYEPVWAIGTGLVAKTMDIDEITEQLAAELEKNQAPAPILYGGSVKPDNYAEIINLNCVNGALVGGASLKAESFTALYDIQIG